MGEMADMDVEAWESGYPLSRSWVGDGCPPWPPWPPGRRSSRPQKPKQPTATITLRLKDGTEITVPNSAQGEK